MYKEIVPQDWTSKPEIFGLLATIASHKDTGPKGRPQPRPQPPKTPGPR